jgi:hypothetical protein
LSLAPTVGFLVFTPPVAASLSRVVRTTVIDARPDGGSAPDCDHMLRKSCSRPINPVYRALGWSSADYIQIHCGAMCAD